MKTPCTLALSFLALLPVVAHSQAKPAIAKPAAATEPKLAPNYGKLPLSFEANHGQIDPQVKFLSRGQGYSLFLTDKAAVLSLTRSGPNRSGCRIAGDRKPGCPTLNDSSSVVQGGKAQKPASAPLKTDTVRMELAGASPSLHIEGAGQLPGIANYFLGKDPAKWHSNIPTYAKVKYAGVYPGVDLVYYGNQRQLEYDFVVAPGASPKPVKLHFAGAEKLKIDASGDLTVTAKNGEIAFHKPVVYQQKSGQLKSGQLEASQRELVDGQFVLLADNTIGFKLGSYDPSRELVIDPVLGYSTYLGGSDYVESGNSMVVDGQGNAYVTGTTGPGFPVTSGAFQSTFPGESGYWAAYVTKLNATGTALVYSTYLSGTYSTQGNAVAIDAQNNVYVTGVTSSTDFPITKGAYQQQNNSPGNGNAFVSKLNPSGSELIYSTYLGGTFPSGGSASDSDSAIAIALDSSGDAYVTGQAYSPNFPTTDGAFDPTPPKVGAPGYPTVFLTKFNATGTNLVFSTFLGGKDDDYAESLAVDSSGDAYVAGFTDSSNFPTTSGVLQPLFENSLVGFVTKFNTSGSALVYSTFFGGNDGTQIFGLALDGSGDAFLTGNTPGTYGSSFPITPGAFQKTGNGYKNAFVSELNPGATDVVYSTYLGGSVDNNPVRQVGDVAAAIAVDAAGHAFVTGYAQDPNFPVTPDAFQTRLRCSGGNAFLTEFNTTGSSLIYSTYLGGFGTQDPTEPSICLGDNATAIALDASGNVYVSGDTASYDFPVTTGAFQKVNHAPMGNNPGYNGFISKFSYSTTESGTTISSDSSTQDVGVAVTFTAAVVVYPNTIPSGDVTFSVDGSTVATVALDANGRAKYATAGLTAGTHTVTAQYPGVSGSVLPSSASLTQTIVDPAATPVFSPPGGTFSAAQLVTITSSAANAVIHYTTDGTTPNIYSQTYTGPIVVVPPTIVQAIAVEPGGGQSLVGSAGFTLPPSYAVDFGQGFADAGATMQLNGSAAVSGTGLQLTNGGLNQAGSAFFATPVNVQAFTTDFTFQLANPAADGFTLTIQNTGPAALGGNGAGLGYVGVHKSLALKFDLYNNAGEGPDSTGIFTAGNTPTVPATNLKGTGIDLHSGDAMGVHVTYDGANLTVTITDQSTGAVWSGVFPAAIPTAVGGKTAYVGFTASTGGVSATQTITAWTYVPGAPAAPNYPTGFRNAAGIILNNAAKLSGNALQLTNGGQNQRGTAVYSVPVTIQSFTNDFTFQLLDPVADGFTFVMWSAVHSDPRYVGGSGSGLGYVTIPGSAAIKFDLFDNAGEGPNSTGLFTGGNTPTVPAVDLTGTGIDLHSGDPMGVHMTYNGTKLAMTITDLTTKAAYSHFWYINLLPALAGNSAYVGFTASTGGVTATQNITSWTFVPGPPVN